MESCSIRKILRRTLQQKKLNSDGNCDGRFDVKVYHNFEEKLPKMRFFGILTGAMTESVINLTDFSHNFPLVSRFLIEDCDEILLGKDFVTEFRHKIRQNSVTTWV